jgi:hypothetical protein
VSLPLHSTITMGLISPRSKNLLSLEAILEPSSCKFINDMRLKYGGTPWSGIGLFFRLRASAVNDYRKAATQITSLHAPFNIGVGHTFRSYGRTRNQVGLDLASAELQSIQTQLHREIKSPYLSAIRKLPLSTLTIQHAEEHFSNKFRPKVGIKYHCSDEEADAIFLKLEEELKTDRGMLKVIGIALRETFPPPSSARAKLHLEKKKLLREEFLFKG